MCSIGDEPPPLIDPTKRRPKTPDLVQKPRPIVVTTGGREKKAEEWVEELDEDETEQDELEEIDVDRLLMGYYDDEGAFVWDEDDENEDEDEDEDEEEEEDEEEDEDEDEYEEEEEESFEDEDCEPDTQAVCQVRPSDANFQESDLEDRKNRRYLIGVHSFLELKNPELENALEPAEEVIEMDECGGPFSMSEEKSRLTLKEEKKKYKDLCNELGVKPDPKVLANLRNAIMDLSNMGMSAKEIIAVCKVLETNTYVQWLSLAFNSAGADGGMAIAELIRLNRTISTYILSGTEILEAFDAICDAISENPSIIHLNFAKNDLEDVDMPAIRKVLRGLCPLQVLNLNGNLIKDEGLRNVGQGLADNKTMEDIDLSHNKILGDKKTGVFFGACADHPELKFISLRRNFIRDDGGKGIGRVMLNNPKIEEIDVSFNLFGDGSTVAIGRGMGRPESSLSKLLIEFQRFREKQAAAILKPLGNEQVKIPIEIVDFGMMLDIHKDFIKEKEKALKVHPDLVITHGQTYGLEHANGPDLKQLVIRKADAVCKSFETPLVMLMEELAKEKKELTQKEFRKFIKQCNLYKDKTVTDAFENVFEVRGGGGINGEAILEAFDKEYPGLRKIPEPVDEEEEEMEEKPKKEKKGKGKGKGKGGKEGGGAAKGKKGGKGKK